MLNPAPLYCPTSHILLSLRHHFPLLPLFIRLQLTSSPAIDQFNSTPLSSQTSAAAQQQSSIFIAHTTYYPLCSHLTLTPTACNNTIVIVANILYRPASLLLLAIAPLIPIFTTPLVLCLSTFPCHLISIIPTFYIWPIHYYLQHSIFTTLTPFLHTLFLHNCSPFSLTIMMQIVSILHHTYSTHIKYRLHFHFLPFVPF